MATVKPEACYPDCCVQSFQFYLERSGEHRALLQWMDRALPSELYRIGEGKTSLDVLGVGSGGGQMDVHMLTLLRDAFPAVPISADVVEGSATLVENFKASLAKTAQLGSVPFSWHATTSENYIQQTKANGNVKRFDFIHMIQMICYVNDMAATIRHYHGLLKKNGRLLIIAEAAEGGWDTLWKTLEKDHRHEPVSEYRSCGEVKTCLHKLGLKYDEHRIQNRFDISECFDPESALGRDLLNFMAADSDFYADFTPEIRAAILDILKNKCSSAQTDGKVMFDGALGCVLVHA